LNDDDPTHESPGWPSGIEVWRGGVNTWECDEMGHLNVRFYVARAVEGLVGLAAALGLGDAFRSTAAATLLVKEQHIRFLREARSRAQLHMMAGVIEIGEDDARLAQWLIHSDSGEVAASFQTVVAHVTARDERRFPWSDRTLARADALMVSVPAAIAPRGLSMAPAVSAANLARADALGLISVGGGALDPQDCDIFGRMRPELFIGRVSDGVPGLVGALRATVASSAPERHARVGGAVVEYRLLHHAWPRAGDRFVLRSGLAGLDHRTQRMVHWMLDPATGQAWASAEAVAVSFDLDTRKIIPISEEAQVQLRGRITPGLSL
jgi:acyl-CoA thioester hydrolase